MAAQTCATAQHATLSGSTADSVTFTGNGNTLCVTNRAASASLYFRFDGTTAVADADDTYIVLAGQSKTLSGHWGKPVISLVGSSNAYSVELF